MASGIRDKVVILGMGCSKFGERWDANAEDLMVEAFEEAMEDAGIEREPDRGGLVRHRHRGAACRQVRRAAGGGAAPALHPGDAGRELLRHRHRGVPRRRLCRRLGRGATSRSRSACEKLKDTGYGGLPQRGRGGLNNHATGRTSRRRASFAQLAAAYRAKHGVDAGDLKRAMAHVSVKSHDNGVAEPEGASAQPDHEDDGPECADGRRAARPRTIAAACPTARPAPSSPRRRSRAASARRICIGGQGAAARGLERQEAQYDDWDGSYFATTRIAAKRAYQEAGIDDPRSQISLVEVHDCFSITELVTMEDLQHLAGGQAPSATCSTASTIATARCPARSTAG